MMYYHTKFCDPASNSINICSGQGFPLLFYKGKIVGHSDLVLVHATMYYYTYLRNQRSNCPSIPNEILVQVMIQS